MTCTFVVGYDGSDEANRALAFAVERAKEENASIVVAHVLEWSPFSFLTPSELEERHKLRGEEIERAKKVILDPVLEKLSGSGLEIEAIVRHGHVANTMKDLAEKVGADQIFIGRSGESARGSRIFGSTVGALVQIASVPCTIVP